MTPTVQPPSGKRLRRGAVAFAAALAILTPLTTPGAALAATEAPAGTSVARGQSPFRIMVTSDAEIDDVASFHRLLLEANDLSDSLEAVIYSSSTFHWAGDPAANPPIPASNWAGSDVFQNIIDGTGPQGVGGGYKAVLDNLRKHDPRFPSVEHLNSLIKVGNISYRGEMQKDTEGSDAIKAALLDNDPRPLYLPVWGGTNTIAAALRSIENQYKGTKDWQKVYNKVVAKANVYIILDQDETYKDYIDPHWPDLNVTVNRDQFWSFAYNTYRYQGARGLPRVPKPLEDAYFGPAYVGAMRTGPLMGTYPVSADAYVLAGDRFPNTTEFLSEGDSPSYFGLLDNGLRSWEDPSFGGWGGRFTQVSQHRWTDFPSYLANKDQAYNQRNYDLEPSRVRDANPYGESFDVAYAQTRFIPALQEELAARSEWQTKSYADANHAPVVRLRGNTSVTAKPGARVNLDAAVSDPDGDKVTTTWWQYREAGTYSGAVAIAGPSDLRTSFTVPADAQPGQTIHLILEVKDQAGKPMTRYARVVVTVH
ncbi:DUF1593 domain-containing protein [Dactylosporangium maewongense]|uniref:DUF1593 domain-containing protein n=1 Tax=Dactylosporangium maewongense TaxID=634393 RepID=A0ABP4MPK4_9ACTN